MPKFIPGYEDNTRSSFSGMTWAYSSGSTGARYRTLLWHRFPVATVTSTSAPLSPGLSVQAPGAPPGEGAVSPIHP